MSNIEQSKYWNLYDPNWEEKFNIHMDAYKALAENSLDLDDDMREQMNMHDQGWKDAHRSQFKNGQEYADFMLESLKQTAKIYNLAWLEIDTSNIETPEQAVAAFNQAHDFIETQQKDRRNGMPVAKDSTLFSEENTKSFHVTIEYPNNRFPTETIVSAQEDGDQINVCLTYLKQNQGPSVINNVETVATQLYNGMLYQKYPDPNKIKWYTHTPASHGPRESFCQIPMSYKDNRFYDGDFVHQKEVPSAIKKANFNAAQDDIHLPALRQQPAAPGKTNNFLSTIKKLILGS